MVAVRLLLLGGRAMVAQTIDELVCARAACAHATVTTLKLYFQSLSETGYATDTLVRRLYSIYGYTHPGTPTP